MRNAINNIFSEIKRKYYPTKTIVGFATPLFFFSAKKDKILLILFIHEYLKILRMG